MYLYFLTFLYFSLITANHDHDHDDDDDIDDNDNDVDDNDIDDIDNDERWGWDIGEHKGKLGAVH